jgi:hypothetical protein
MNELPGNVYENKGPLWKAWRRSWNVIENKGTCGFKAGILLKTNWLYHSGKTGCYFRIGKDGTVVGAG